jgi:hypothetical protein
MTTIPVPERTAPRPGVVGPLILIGLGVAFLLSNLGLLSVDVWEALLRLWPILLIAVGLDILFGRRSLLGSLLVTVATVALIVGGLWWFGQGPGGTPLASETISESLRGATRAEVELSVGVGTLELGAMDEAQGLIAGAVRTAEPGRVLRDFALRGDTAVLRLRERDMGGLMRAPWSRDSRWDLRLNPNVPTKLTINTGVGAARLSLGDLAISELRISAGVGQTIITLPRRGAVHARIDGGVGQTTVTIPNDVAVRIVVTKGLGAITTPQGLDQAGRSYTTPGYATAANRVDLAINGGVGAIRIAYE